MEEFVKERYNYHYNFQIKSVTRKEAPLKGPQEFTVVTAQSDPRAWPHYSSLFFGAIASKSFPPPTSLGSIVFFIQNTLLNGVGAGIAIMLGIIVTSFFIPNMMRKGSIDLMLSKPIGRVQLLLNKYLGGLSFMFIFATVTVGSVWLVFGLRSGLWNPKFLLLIPLWTYAFGILYALSTLISVWTRSAIASLLLTLAFNGMLWVTATTYNALDGIRKTPLQEQMPTWVNPTADFVNAVLPRTRDLDVITTKLIADVLTENDQQKSGIGDIEMPSVFGSVGVSFAWIAGMLGLACWRFTRKDY
jgi:ABC-type transport system involved in multi-copper enzyme maturation permease subunit